MAILAAGKAQQFIHVLARSGFGTELADFPGPGRGYPLPRRLLIPIERRSRQAGQHYPDAPRKGARIDLPGMRPFVA